MKPARFLASVATLFALSASLSSAIADDNLEVRPTISVSGNAQVKVAPDQAVLQFSIVNQEKELGDTTSANDKTVADVSAFLTKSGVENRYINTDLIRITPIYARQNSPYGKLQTNQSAARVPADDVNRIKPIGYSATRSISVTVTDLTKLETLYKGLLANGVNKVDGVSFTTTESRKHMDEARLKAIRAAREKAAALAEELGAKLAGVQSIVEGSSPSSRYVSPMMNSISFQESPSNGVSSIARGEIGISASVSVVFRLKETGFDP